ncbi:MAG: hypothetical protein IJY01_08410, partial [Clostridia bacterium]|nr:hypothetical protein [Clostridia bacterium]
SLFIIHCDACIAFPCPTVQPPTVCEAYTAGKYHALLARHIDTPQGVHIEREAHIEFALSTKQIYRRDASHRLPLARRHFKREAHFKHEVHFKISRLRNHFNAKPRFALFQINY